MPANECIPYHEPGQRLTGTPTTAVVGKRFVAISGNQQADGTWSIAPSAAGGRALGVASYDGAVGAKVPVVAGAGYIVPVTAGAALTAGQEVEADATARAIPLAAGRALGVVMTAQATVNSDAKIRLYG